MLSSPAGTLNRSVVGSCFSVQEVKHSPCKSWQSYGLGCKVLARIAQSWPDAVLVLQEELLCTPPMENPQNLTSPAWWLSSRDVSTLSFQTVLPQTQDFFSSAWRKNSPFSLFVPPQSESHHEVCHRASHLLLRICLQVPHPRIAYSLFHYYPSSSFRCSG